MAFLPISEIARTMNTEMTIVSKQKNLVKELLIDINKNLVSESVLDQCCIYKVPRRIRRVNEELYTPELISIGPLYYDGPELTDMEKNKKQHVKDFFARTTKEKIDEIVSFIENKEEQIRACYAEESQLESHGFVRMIFYDSIFIIEFFLATVHDVPRGAESVNRTLQIDLQLFENQLPFFILKEIYELAFVDKGDMPTFMELSFHFIEGEEKQENPKLYKIISEMEVKHFTDWKRITLVKDYPKEATNMGWVENLPCAVKLHESGVKFKVIECDNLLDIKFEERKHLIPFLKVYELQIPQLIVIDDTEREFRNIIALEQCVYPNNALVSNYVALLDYLINTEEDVDLLVRKEIILNFLGDNASVAKMFNRLNHNVPISPSPYSDICKHLQDYYKKPHNRAKGPLKRVYCSDPWRGTATVAAIILLFLTVVQTVCSIWQVVLF
ncbi:UPF0481 protein At3g47200-like [Mangifera indica]|uniref:UPF0481 protein At3g47200-like n=1 Tax=Mangifera indica TaxID=29780 RepID=UPI001CFBA7F1|nr:UPF0481 protein At3g47200-like [Mangifera indica]